MKLCTPQALAINTPFLRKLPGYFSRIENFLVNGPKQYSSLRASVVTENIVFVLQFPTGFGLKKLS
jgi:hypothetical protein